MKLFEDISLKVLQADDVLADEQELHFAVVVLFIHETRNLV